MVFIFHIKTKTFEVHLFYYDDITLLFLIQVWFSFESHMFFRVEIQEGKIIAQY